MLHIPIVHSHDISKQIPQEKKFSLGWKCYNTIGSYVSCVFIEIWSTWEVWRALKKLELLSATPWATLMRLSCSPNFPRASYLDERTLTYEPIVKENKDSTNGIVWLWEVGKGEKETQSYNRIIESYLNSAQFKDHQHYLRHSVMALNKKGERGREKI